jgi:hypothetical protein
MDDVFNNYLNQLIDQMRNSIFRHLPMISEY